MWGRGDNLRGESEEMSADAPIFSVCISKIIQIWGGRQILAVEIQKTLCGGINADDFIE